MKVLVIAEHDNKNLNDSTLKTVSAATKIAADIDMLVAGSNSDTVAEAASKVASVSKVLHADDSAYANNLPENMANLLLTIAKNYTHIMAPSNTFGKNFLPRVAALLDVAQITDVMEIISENTFKRPIYAGNAIATVESLDAIKVMTIRTTAFGKADANPNNATIEKLDSAGDSGLSSFVKIETSDSKWPDLTSASVVISGGRGMENGDNFKLLETIAKKIDNCAIGASRAAVDAGFVPNDMQVGQTGKIVAPDLYIAVGLSGAIQHLAGMKDSKIIVAINKDENAPIFEVADYGIVADLFDVLPEMEKLL